MNYKEIAIVWYDAAQRTYAEQIFDNDWMVSEITTTMNGNTWTDTGQGRTAKGKSTKTRTTNT